MFNLSNFLLISSKAEFASLLIFKFFNFWSKNLNDFIRYFPNFLICCFGWGSKLAKQEQMKKYLIKMFKFFEKKLKKLKISREANSTLKEINKILDKLKYQE